MQGPTRKFFLALGAITLLGLSVRLAYTIGVRWDQKLWGDAFQYHWSANGIVEGKWFYDWIPKSFSNYVEFARDAPASWSRIAIPLGPSAGNPPLYPLYLAAWSFVGLDTYHWHMIASVLLGTASVFTIGLVGREIVGPRTGLLAAGIAAVYANFWVHDAVGTSESMAILASCLILLLAYRAWDQPTLRRVAALGAMGGLASLIRAEFVILLPMLLVALIVRRLWDRPVRERLAFLVIPGVVALLVMTPWVIRNLVTFENPVLVSSDAGLSLAATNCDATYHGAALGWWDPSCVPGKTVEVNGKCKILPLDSPVGLNRKNVCDPTESDALWRKRGVNYIEDHLGRLPVVLLARVGRMWEIYHPGSPYPWTGDPAPDQKLNFDIIEGRSKEAARLALTQFYLLAPFVVAGLVILWRRRKPVAPLVSFIVLVTITGMYAFGNTRYRAVAEPALALLAAVAFDALLTRYWDRRRARGDREDPLSDPEPVAVTTSAE